jgi:hypothetical protein
LSEAVGVRHFTLAGTADASAEPAAEAEEVSAGLGAASVVVGAGFAREHDTTHAAKDAPSNARQANGTMDGRRMHGSGSTEGPRE